MNQVKRGELAFNVCLGLNVMVLFLAIFSSQLNLPGLLQVGGRMHPMLLHFPIVLMFVVGVLEWKSALKEDYRLRDLILMSLALSAGLTALFGMFLSVEDIYNADQLLWHKWGGVTLMLISFGWYAFRGFLRQNEGLNKALILGSIAVTLWTGHQGASITHGENFLWAPMLKSSTVELPAIEEAEVYADLVQNIFNQRCISCHNAKKAKGELVLENEAAFRKGGKHGNLIDTISWEQSLLLERLHLPEAEEHHMPPTEKKQLSDIELALISEFIKQGAKSDVKLMDLPEGDSLRILAEKLYSSRESEAYDFPPADPQTIRKLNNEFCTVQALSQSSPALQAEFFGVSGFRSEHLLALAPITKQLIGLNLSKMPLTSADIKFIASLENLRKLNLSFSSFLTADLKELKSLEHLSSLVLSGVDLNSRDLEVLKTFPALKRVYLWNTGIANEDIHSLEKSIPNLKIETGFNGDTIVAKLNAPVIQGEERIFKDSLHVSIKNYIKGAKIHYTLDDSEPDSINSPVLDAESILIQKTSLLKTKSFLRGWISSDVSAMQYYRAAFTPDSVSLRYPPNPKYLGEGGATLIDRIIGDNDFQSKKWLGFREKPMEVLFYFEHPKQVSSVTVSSLTSVGSYLMPPKSVEVWGGMDEKKLRLLKRMTPRQLTDMTETSGPIASLCEFEKLDLKYIKLIVQPLPKLPSWHPGKGDRGWVFVGEVLFN